MAEPWITPDNETKLGVYGVFAVDKSNTLWACFSSFPEPNRAPQAPAALKAFDLQTGALKARYLSPPRAANASETCRKYAELLRQYRPQLCLPGIGENGHLAFNDPTEADFNDPLDIKIVSLDEQCRQQQVNEGWVAIVSEVLKRAITLTIPGTSSRALPHRFRSRRAQGAHYPADTDGRDLDSLSGYHHARSFQRHGLSGPGLSH